MTEPRTAAGLHYHNRETGICEPCEAEARAAALDDARRAVGRVGVISEGYVEAYAYGHNEARNDAIAAIDALREADRG